MLTVRTLRVLLCAALACFWAAAARANDNFPGTILSGTSGSLTASNVGATSQTNENTTYGGGSVNSMWYSWTAPASGVFTAATCNVGGESTTNFDTTLIAYTGSAFPLTAIAASDDTIGCDTSVSADWASVVSFNATAGTTYRLQVDGYQNATGTFVLRWGLAGLSTTVTDSSAWEGNDTATFTIRPNSPPGPTPPANSGTAAVTTTVTLGTSSQCTFSPSTLTFTSGNWTTAQTVTVTAIDDAVAEGTHSCAPASIVGSGGAYAGTSATPPTITVYDNDNPGLTVTKTASVASISSPGTITYTIGVRNSGSALLTSPSISDTLQLGASTLTLTSGPTYVSGDTNSDNRMENNETWTYTATYAVTQANINTGGTFSNTATFSTTQFGPVTSSPATTAIIQNPVFTISKTQSSGPSPVTAAGQVLGYSISVSNTGNVTLTGPVMTDVLQLGGNARTLTAGPSFVSGDTNSNGSLDLGETWTYSASYTVPQADIDATGSFTNQATFDTTQTAPLASNTVTTNVTRTPSLSISKSWSFANAGDDADGDGKADKNDIVTYRFAVTNTGNVTISNVVVNDVFSGSGTAPVPGNELITGDIAPIGDSTDTTSNNGTWTTLRPGDTVTYRGTYVVTQGDIDHG